MNTLVETIIGGAILAALSGLAFIAYRHPAGYRFMYTPLFWGAWGVWLLCRAYRWGLSSGFYGALGEVRTLNPTAVLQIPSLESEPWLFGLAPLAFIFYLGFLRLLPFITGIETVEQFELKTQPLDKADVTEKRGPSA